MNNRQISQVFSDVAGLLQIKGEPVFKVRAYERAAETIASLPFELGDVASDEKALRAIPGFGDAITGKVQEMVATGRLGFYERLRSEFPEGVLSLMQVPGIGPKTALKAAQELGTASLADLEKALESGAFARLPRVGEKNAANILRHLRHRLSQGDRVPIGEALPAAERIIRALGAACPGARRHGYAGSLRRGRETVGDLDLICTSDDPQSVTAAFAALPFVQDIVAKGDTKASVVMEGGLKAELRVANDASYGALLLYLTGSQQHNTRLRERAQSMGLSLNEYGITDTATGKTEQFATEDAIYHRLGLQPVPPEMREDSGEIEASAAGQLPGPVALSDIRGDLHSHTTWSDGKESLEGMVNAARARGLEYIAITDHSKSQTVANGLNEELLRLHHAAVLEAQAKSKDIGLLSGTEMDILPDGSLDYPDETLAGLDIVLGSIHSAMDQDRAAMTARIIKAMHSPHLDVIAHLTTRLIGRRAPIEVDFDAVCHAAVETGTVLEINASTPRLDLHDAHIRRARELGVTFAVNTDSHRPEDFAQMRYGVQQARRGWCETWRVINTLPYAELRSLLSAPKTERYARLASRAGRASRG